MIAALDRVGAVTVKEFRHLVRDPRALALVLLLPILQLLLFAYAISFDVRDVPTLVVDTDNTPASRDFLQAFEGSPFFDIVGISSRYQGVEEAFDSASAQVGIIVPAGFSRQLASGQTAQVAILIDGTEPTSARVAQAYATALARQYGQQLAIGWAERQGVDLTASGGLIPQLRTWYNPERKSSDFLIPGLMAIIIAIVTVQQTAVTLVKETDQGTAEQLMVSPLRQVELMIGKVLPWTLLALLDVVVIIALAVGWFEVPLRGDLGVLATAATLFVFACLGMGLSISAIAPTPDTANITALMIAFLPSFLLSGLAFPLDQIPTVLQWVAAAFPAQYMVTVARGVFLKGLGWELLWPQLAALAGYAVAMIGLSGLLYSRRTR